ncbi:MAG: NAD(P)/FAD-dependent oxidoreductase [Flavobacteriales bacterium]|nr:NAD(P)/FAD-dependent oxidoreductase [Flavobacteriales bacterium]
MYDIVIIGSGFGGLSCGLMLSKEGYKVCILEKNRQIGGSLQIFSKDKTIFDTGIHYIGGLAEGQNLYKVFKYFNILDDLKLKQLDVDGFDRIRLKDDPVFYPHAQGHDNFVRVLSHYFPSEKQNIRSYMDYIIKVCDSFPLYRLQEGEIDLFSSGYLNQNALEVIKSFTNNVKLQQVLAGSNAIYAGVPEKTPFYLHALSVNSYIESSWKCVDGSGQISKLMTDQIKKNGGDIFNYSEAVKFNFDEKKILSVELENGEIIEGKNFISNIDLKKTMAMIEEGKIRSIYRNRINSMENTISAFLLNIVFKPDTVKMVNHNLYYYKIDDLWDATKYDKSKWPESIAMFCPAVTGNNDYAKNMTLMAYMRYDEMELWKDTFRTTPRNKESRGESYEEFKEEKSRKLIDLYTDIDPDVRSKIKSYSASTPLTYRDYIGSTDGNLYGILKDCNDPLKTFITAKTKIPNLYLTGQNMNFHGVLGVAVNAIKTCSEFLGSSYLLSKINHG